MKKKIQQGIKQKNKIRIRFLYVIAVSTLFITIGIGLLVILNLNNLTKTRAKGTTEEGGGIDLSKGEIISEFNWEADPVTTSIVGPDGKRACEDAHAMTGGRSSSNGLAPGPNGKNIDLEIEDNELFNQDGLDISIDFRRNEPSGDFFSRGKAFNFGMDQGFLIISYKIENNLGKVETVNAKTDYEIPTDRVFRTFRFIFTPLTGKSEIFANGLIVWQKQHEKNSALYWKNAGKIMVGRNMNGGGEDKVVFDNLIVRNSGSVIPFSESLLNFMLEMKDGGVKVHWSTSANKDVAYFSVERSLNGTDFTTVGIVNARSDSAESEYTYLDKTTPGSTVVYYRLKQSFKNKKFITHELSAIKFNSQKSFSIDHINPIPFKTSFDVSYYLPGSGQVWMQISDDKGKILITESFDAPRGKNVHVFKDEKNLQPGEYNLSLIFENKKVTRKVVKL